MIAEIQISLIVILFLISALGGLSAWCIFVWAIKDKQFDNTEDVAMRLNQLDEVNAVETEASRKSKEGAQV